MQQNIQNTRAGGVCGWPTGSTRKDQITLTLTLNKHIYIRNLSSSSQQWHLIGAQAPLPAHETRAVGVVVTWGVAIAPPRVQFPDGANLPIFFFY